MDATLGINSGSGCGEKLTSNWLLSNTPVQFDARLKLLERRFTGSNDAIVAESPSISLQPQGLKLESYDVKTPILANYDLKVKEDVAHEVGSSPTVHTGSDSNRKKRRVLLDSDLAKENADNCQATVSHTAYQIAHAFASNPVESAAARLPMSIQPLQPSFSPNIALDNVDKAAQPKGKAARLKESVIRRRSLNVTDDKAFVHHSPGHSAENPGFSHINKQPSSLSKATPVPAPFTQVATEQSKEEQESLAPSNLAAIPGSSSTPVRVLASLQNTPTAAIAPQAQTPAQAAAQTQTKPTPRKLSASKMSSIVPGQRTLAHFFPMIDSGSRDSDAVMGAGLNSSAVEPMEDQAGHGPELEDSKRRTAELTAALGAAQEQVMLLQQQLESKAAELSRCQAAEAAAVAKADASAADLASMAARASAVAQDLENERQRATELDTRWRGEVVKLLQAAGRWERDALKSNLAARTLTLGNFGVVRAGPMAVQEVWEDGAAFQQISARLAAIAASKEQLEAAKKALRKRLAPPPSSRSSGAVASDTGSGQATTSRNDESSPDFLSGEAFVAQDELLRARLAALKREEESIRAEEERMTAEKGRHMRALKRLRDESESRFGNFPVLSNQYVLGTMMGRGGFSEVFRAYDLKTCTYVAVKVHQLNSQWHEARKASYVRHAIREYDIQRSLSHPNIVRLTDILEIDASSFATVLELCEGGDLDALMREHTTMPEREVRAITSQIFSGLAYLNQPGTRVIHYDLKPANILFDALGNVKISDFGLSKIMEDGGASSMELTSAGAGTYWYLPPECFELSSGSVPRISNKVDVWSGGVIAYQMLYGKRPFGEGLSQEQVLRDRVMLNARSVDFPAKPTVSAEGKEFIRRCLAHRQEDRWDVLTAAVDPWLVMTRK